MVIQTTTYRLPIDVVSIKHLTMSRSLICEMVFNFGILYRSELRNLPNLPPFLITLVAKSRFNCYFFNTFNFNF